MGKSSVLSGPGKLGSIKAVKQSLKSKGNANIRNVPKEDSITVRFLENPEDFYGYYEHFVNGTYQPCVTDECDGCTSDNPEESKKMFRYLANAYVVDDQKVRLLKLPKSLVESLVEFYTKYKTLLDRDYELKRTGSGQNDTRYTAVPESESKMKLSRFMDQMFDHEDELSKLIDGAEDEPEPKPKKKGKKHEPDPWDDEDDEPVVKKSKKKKSASAGKSSGKTVVKKKRSVAPKSSGTRTVVKKKKPVKK